jgi:hypothetical protein
MATTTDIRKGLKIQIDGVPYHIVEHQFVKPGKGQSFTRCRVRNLTNGNVVERTWKSGDSVELADVEDRDAVAASVVPAKEERALVARRGRANGGAVCPPAHVGTARVCRRGRAVSAERVCGLILFYIPIRYI